MLLKNIMEDMTYPQTLLSDKPIGLWLLAATSGTTETDLSGNAKHATISEATDLLDRNYRPLCANTGSDIAFRFYSGLHKLSYPALEVWDKGRSHIPFSVEFTLQPIRVGAKAVIFAPQETGPADVFDNGIYVENGQLKFVVSDSTASTKGNNRYQVAYFVQPGEVYHVVCMYNRGGITMWINGQQVDSAVIENKIVWQHTVASFATYVGCTYKNIYPGTEIVLDAVSVFKGTLSPQQINDHYTMSTPNISDVQIAQNFGGTVFGIDDSDRLKVTYKKGQDDWLDKANTLTNLEVKDNGDLGLRKIPPAKLMNTQWYYGNLINQAAADAEVAGATSYWSPYGHSAFTTTSSQAYQGSSSFSITANGSAAVGINQPYAQGFAVEYGETITVTMAIKQATGTGRTGYLGLQFLDSAGKYIQNAGAAFSALTVGSWTVISKDINIAVANCAYAVLYVEIDGAVNTEVHYLDAIGAFRGKVATWRPSRADTFVLGAESSYNYPNLIGYNESAMDYGTGAIGNSSSVSNTLAASPTVYYSGQNAVKLTANATGVSSITVSAIPINAGQKYTYTAKVRPTVSSRTITAYVNWYDSDNNALGNSGLTATSSTTANTWHTLRGTGVAPTRAVRGDLYVQCNTTLNTEVTYYDELGVFEGDVTTWTEGAFDTVNGKIKATEDSRYILVENAATYFGSDQGGIGCNFDITTALNNTTGEQVVASVMSSDKTSYFEVVKKSDKNLYLRYGYFNTAGALTTSEASWGSITGILDTTAYFYLEWNHAMASLYINSTSSPAQIAFDSGIPFPIFDRGSSIYLGAGVDMLRPWMGAFKWLNIYNSIQPTANFTANKTSVGGYTLKLAKNLNVSQKGTAIVALPPGTDGADTMTQSRLVWEPDNTNISTTYSTDNVTYYKTANYGQVKKPGIYRNLVINPSYENATINVGYPYSNANINTGGMTEYFNNNIFVNSYFTSTITTASTGTWSTSTRVFGNSGLKVDVPNQANAAGMIHMAAEALEPGEIYSIGAWVRVPNGTQFQIGHRHHDDQNIGYIGEGFSTAVTATGNWQWVTKNAITGPPQRFLPGIQLVLTASQGSTKTFYVDGVVVMRGSSVPEYFDGDQPGCYWEGLPHQSPSVMVAREGDVNRIFNPVAEGPVWNYSTYNAGMAVAADKTLCYSGTQSIKVTCTDFTANSGQVRIISLMGGGASQAYVFGNPNITTTVVPGEKFYAGLKYYISNLGGGSDLRLVIVWWGVDGSTLSTSTANPSTTTGQWLDATISGTVPANAYSCTMLLGIYNVANNNMAFNIDNVYYYRVDAANSITPSYKDGNTTGWDWSTRVPASQGTFDQTSYNAAVTNSVPNMVWAKQILTTDDSWNYVTSTRNLSLEILNNSRAFATNGWTELVGNNKESFFNSSDTAPFRSMNSGAYIRSSSGALTISPQIDYNTFTIPDGGSAPSSGGEMAYARTVEFWVYPESYGYFFYQANGVWFGYDATGIKINGWSAYVDGAAVSANQTITNWLYRWHHVIITTSGVPIVFSQNYVPETNLASYDRALGQTTTGLFSTNPATITTSQDFARYGNTSVKVVWANASYNDLAYGNAGSTAIPVDRTISMTGSVSVYLPGGQTAIPNGTQGKLSVWCYDNANAFINGVDITGAYTNLTADSWTTLTGSLAANAMPAGTVKVNPVFWLSGTSAVNGYLYIQKWGIWNNSTQTAWVPPNINRGLLGGAPPGSEKAIARYQNVAYYPTGFTTSQVLDNYKFYLGDNTGLKVYDAGNILTSNEIAADTDTTGFSIQQGSGSIARVVGATGGNIRLTLSAAAPAAVAVDAVPVIGGRDYFGSVRMKSSALSGSTINARIFWKDSTGADISNVFGANYTMAGNWVETTVQATAPTNAAYAVLVGRVATGGVSTNTIDFDDFSLNEGTTQPLQTRRTITDAPNLLTDNEATMELGTTAGFSAGTNTSVTVSGAQKISGSYGLVLTANSASGGMLANIGTSVADYAKVIPNETYTAVGWVKSAATARPWFIAITWWNSAGSYISGVDNGALLSTTTGWTRLYITSAAPSTAAYASLYVSTGTVANGEIHYFDQFGIFRSGTFSDWISPTALPSTNPKTFSDIWTIQKVDIGR